MSNLEISLKNRLVTVAPMMDWTDRHFRYLTRLISKNTLLYTEMVVTGAILYGHRDRFLQFHAIEHPIAVQLGGSHPEELKKAALICQDYGYDEINLNIGCPSDRVQAGKFGACLMAEADVVADCVNAIKSVVKIPVTIKTRIGIDRQDSYEFLSHFIQQTHAAGCQHYIIHARKAWLKGLSPKENRTIPPLDYQRVYQLKKDFSELHISINGGIQTLEHIKKHLEQVDGTMIGREVYQNTYFLAEIEKNIFQNSNILGREDILENYLHYAFQQKHNGVPIKYILKHLMGLYHGQANAREKRRNILELGQN